MLTRFLVYFTLTPLYLFSGVSAAVIGSPPDLDTRHISSLNQRDTGEQPNQNSNLPQDIEDVLGSATQDQVIRLMSEIPDEVLEQGTDATETWLREHLQSSSIAARDSDVDNTELEERNWIDNLFRKPQATIRCTAGLLWIATGGNSVVSEVSKFSKIQQLIQEIKDVGYKKAAKIIMAKEESAKGRKIRGLLREVLGNDWVDDNCPKVL